MTDPGGVKPMAVRVQERHRSLIDAFGQHDVGRLGPQQGASELGRSRDVDRPARRFVA